MVVLRTGKKVLRDFVPLFFNLVQRPSHDRWAEACTCRIYDDGYHFEWRHLHDDGFSTGKLLVPCRIHYRKEMQKGIS